MSQRLIVLDNLRSLHNVGAILRTADGAGWDEVILGGYTGAPPDRRIEKVSLGAENSIAWQAVPVLEKWLEDFRETHHIVALEQTPTAINLWDGVQKMPTKKPLILIVGNEVEGVRPELLALAHEHWQIPMHGKKSSLNVSVAAGVALFVVGQST